MALASALTIGIAVAALAEPAMRQDGQVTAVDRSGRAFTTQVDFASRTYKTSGRTTYSLGGTPTSFEALKTGHRATVDYHMEGTTAVADQVALR
jgi:hypothetical protein